MRNIELKARLAALEAARRTAERLCGEGPAALLGQTDTYFQVDRGRLKLREIEPRGGSPTAELIFYLRADQKGPKRSEYEIAPCADHTDFRGSVTFGRAHRRPRPRRRRHGCLCPGLCP